MAQDEYVTLMASLPALGPMLVARHAPINRVRLEARLKQLRPEHLAELTTVAELLAWSRLPLTGTDDELNALKASYEHLTKLRDEVIEMGVLPPLEQWSNVNPNL